VNATSSWPAQRTCPRANPESEVQMTGKITTKPALPANEADRGSVNFVSERDGGFGYVRGAEALASGFVSLWPHGRVAHQWVGGPP
jgi:hypothetical protein